MLTATLTVIGSTATATAVPPSAPAQLAPADGASVTLPLRISWTEVAGAGGYHWELGTTSTFGTVLERNERLLPGAATTDAVLSGIRIR